MRMWCIFVRFMNLTMFFPYLCFVVDITLSQELGSQQHSLADLQAAAVDSNNSPSHLIVGRGVYALRCSTEQVRGILVRPNADNGKYDGCQRYTKDIPKEPWVVLVERGGCKFEVKISNAMRANASGIVVYDREQKKGFTAMESHLPLTAVSVNHTMGLELLHLVENHERVVINITLNEMSSFTISHTSKASVMLISISFIVLMLVSIIWMVFYYIQRFRYTHAKERLARQLMKLGKKSLAKMPTKTLKATDLEQDSDDMDGCAVCLDNYQASDTIRTLPCKHVFHKDCVDSWLINHRSCPICKCDVLKALGIQVPQSYPPDHEELPADIDQTSFTLSDLDARYSQMELVFFPPARGRGEPTLVYVTPADYPELEALMRERAAARGTTDSHPPSNASTAGSGSRDRRDDRSNRRDELEIVQEEDLQEVNVAGENEPRQQTDSQRPAGGRRGGRWGRGLRGLFTRRGRQL